MALLATQEIDLDGLTPAFAAVAASDTFTPDEDTYLEIVNGGGGSTTVTITTPGTAAGGLAVADAGGSVAAGARGKFGPFPAQHFADSTGVATVTCSPTTSVTIGVFKVPRR